MNGKKKQWFYYFAYGSNMDVNRMAERCPDAKPVGTATLPNYKVVPRMYADLDVSVGDNANGILWRISSDDLKRLDSYEGYPKYYGCFEVPVFTSDTGDCVMALVYIMTKECKANRAGTPYPEHYRQLCSVAARAANIPDAFEK